MNNRYRLLILRTLLSVSCFAFVGQSAMAQNVNILNAAFKNYLLGESGINTLNDGEISFAEAAAFTGGMDIVGFNITDLTGIEAFTSLTSLAAAYNQLSTLDVSNNTALTSLNVEYNQLTALDVTNNPALTGLAYGNNLLTSLDLSANTALTFLDCSGNALNTLDVSDFPALSTLYCLGTQITVLDVSANAALTILDCGDNPLTSLDVSANAALTDLFVSNTPLTSLNVANGNNAAMFVMAEGNASLLCIQVDDIAEPSMANWTLDVTTVPSLDCGPFVFIPDANFKSILLSDMQLNTTADSEISFAEAAAFTGDIVVSGSGISDLTGIEAFPFITYLNCGMNDLTSLDVSANTALTTLYCDYNDLTSLDISTNVELRALSCSSNQLTTLDISANTLLDNINLAFNQIEDMDFSNHPDLYQIVCAENPLMTLDVSTNLVLQALYCANNQLATLDISANTLLSQLYCANNQLTVLDIANTMDLIVLSCAQNQFTDLDLSNHVLLEQLRCQDNLLTSLNVANGNNANMSTMIATGNPNLLCIQVDDVNEPNLANWAIDGTASYNEDCGTLVGIADNEATATIYPNPTTGALFITLPTASGTYTLTDMAGRLLRQGAITTPRFAIDLSGLNAGSYLIRVGTEQGAETHKVLLR